MPLGRADAHARKARPALAGRRLLLALSLALLAGTTGAADERSEAGSVQRRVAQAFGAKNAAGVTTFVRPGGTVKIELLLLDRGGTFRRGQAERTLRDYFRKVSRLRLKDVTPRRQPTSETYRVFTYEYAYKPQGRDAVTSLLTIALRSAGRDRWYLQTIQERHKRRPRR